MSASQSPLLPVYHTVLVKEQVNSEDWINEGDIKIIDWDDLISKKKNWHNMFVCTYVQDYTSGLCMYTGGLPMLGEKQGV